MANIDGVEADKGGEQPPIGFGHNVSDQKRLAGQAGFQHVEGVKHSVKCVCIGRLHRGKAGAVDAVVDILINQSVDCIDFAAQGFGIEIAAFRAGAVESGVEHADDFAAFVGNNGVLLPVPEHRHGHAA